MMSIGLKYLPKIIDSKRNVKVNISDVLADSYVPLGARASSGPIYFTEYFETETNGRCIPHDNFIVSSVVKLLIC